MSFKAMKGRHRSYCSRPKSKQTHSGVLTFTHLFIPELNKYTTDKYWLHFTLVFTVTYETL